MAVSTQVIRFQKDSSGTNGATQDVNLNFTPKAIIIISSNQTGDNTSAAHSHVSLGFSDGTNHACIATSSEDAQTSSDSARIHRNDSVIAVLDTTTPETEVARASVAFATNKITLTWTVNNTDANYYILYALGGADITNVKVNTVQVGTGTGNKDYTGIGFTPTDTHGVLFTLENNSDTSLFLINTEIGSASHTLGCAVSSSKQFTISTAAEDGRPTTDTWRTHASDKCIYSTLSASGALDYWASFVSWIAGGFRLNIGDGASAADLQFSYMVINGGTWDCGNLTGPTSATNDVDTTISVDSKTPRGLLMASAGLGAAAASQTHSIFSVGVTDGTNQGCIGVVDEDGQADSDTSRISNATQILYSFGTTSALSKSATFDSFQGTTAFRLDWASGDANASFCGWVVVADSATSQLFERSITESTISVSDSNARMLTANRTISEPSISVSDANARMLSAFRTISESTINVNETIQDNLIAPRTINEPSIAVSETLDRQLFANRSISESTISVSETLERILTAIRAINEATITVSETLDAVPTVLFTRSITENAIDVSETVDRQTFNFRSIIENTIDVNETVDRLISAFRIITEPSISVSETVDGIGVITRSITEPVISVSETVDKMSSFIRLISEPSISVSETVDRVRTVFREISEPTISVSETLARIIIYPRSITEPSISVSETVDKLSTFIRTINEPSISVNETLIRVLTAFRTISEPSISVSETLAEIGILSRAINEATISVSDALTRTAFYFRTLSEVPIAVSDSVLEELTAVQIRSITEPSISVSETVARTLAAFRSISEPSISVSETVLGESAAFQSRSITEPTIIVSDLVAAIHTFPTLATYIVDPGYTNEVRCRITFKSKIGDDAADPDTGDQIIFYQYDAFHYDSRPFNLLNYSLRLVQGEISVASMDIEDSAENIIDRNKISFGAVVEIDFKKENGRDWKRVMTGFVRRLRIMRPATNALIYRVTVLSKQIVYNERVTNFKRAAKRTAIDSSIPLSTDSNMFANRLFEELHTATDILPLKKPTLQQTGDFVLDTGSISDEVTDFIAEIAPGLGIAADVANSIAEATGAIWGTDEFGNPYLRYPTEKHSGIIIKDDPQDTDSALNTSVNMDSFEYEDTIDQAEGFANRLYVLNSKDTKSTASSSKASGSTTLTTRWIAQSFIATDNNVTGAAFILSKIGNPTNTTGSIKGVLRGSSSNGTFPTGATLATFEISLSQLTNSADVIFVNDIKTETGVINPGTKYWWVLQGTGLFDDTHTVRWHHDNDLVTANRPSSARLPLVDVDPTTPGNQFNWIPSEVGPVYTFSTFSSVNHVLTQSDSESIARNGIIEAVVNLPAFDDDATFQKALVKILQTSAKVKRIFDYTRVTIPTAKLFLPGELVTVIDSKANLDVEKLINAEIVEVTYNFDSSTNAIGCKYADLRLIGFIDSVVDDYLENREC